LFFAGNFNPSGAVEDPLVYLSSGGFTPAKGHQAYRQDGYNYDQFPNYSDHYVESHQSEHYHGTYDSYGHEYQDKHGTSTIVAEYLSTPTRSVAVEQLETQQESEFADPLEVFSWNDRVWYVYMTEQSEVYFLDMDNQHSQWEDPRVHGIISMSSYYDLPPESPSKLSDAAPPLSPALKSPTHSSPSISLPGSAIKSDSELKRVARAFQKVFTFDDEPTDRFCVSHDDDKTLSSLLGVGIASIDRRYSNSPEAVRSVSRSSSEDDDELEKDLVVMRDLAKRNVRKTFIKQLQQQDSRNGERMDQGDGHIDSVDFESKNQKLFDSPDRKDSKFRPDEKLEKLGADPQEEELVSHPDDGDANVASSAKRGKVVNPKRDSWINPSDAKDISQHENHPEVPSKLVLVQKPVADTQLESNPISNSRTHVKLEASNYNDGAANNLIEEGNIDLEQCQRYVEMIHGGKSLFDVRLILEADGRSNKFIKKVMALADDLVVLDDSTNTVLAEEAFASPKPKDSSLIPAKQSEQIEKEEKVDSTITLDNIKDDPVYSKYVKMAKMGVPPMSVITKMKMDGVDGSSLMVMQQALGLAPPPAAMKKDQQNDKEQSKWQPVPEDRLKNSIWAFAVSNEAQGPLLAEQELKELEQLFLAAPSAVITTTIEKTLPPKPTFSLKLLEGKRAQNIAIGLVAFKCFGSHVDVIKAICSLNDFNGRLTADHLANFKGLLPTESEVKKSFLLKNVNHPAEIFVQSALIFYPELPLRLDAFVICLNFTSFASELEKRMKILMEVINQVCFSQFSTEFRT
jgi:hypothetical protein